MIDQPSIQRAARQRRRIGLVLSVIVFLAAAAGIYNSTKPNAAEKVTTARAETKIG